MAIFTFTPRRIVREYTNDDIRENEYLQVELTEHKKGDRLKTYIYTKTDEREALMDLYNIIPTLISLDPDDKDILIIKEPVILYKRIYICKLYRPSSNTYDYGIVNDVESDTIINYLTKNNIMYKVKIKPNESGSKQRVARLTDYTFKTTLKSTTVAKHCIHIDNNHRDFVKTGVEGYIYAYYDARSGIPNIRNNQNAIDTLHREMDVLIREVNSNIMQYGYTMSVVGDWSTGMIKVESLKSMIGESHIIQELEIGGQPVEDDNADGENEYKLPDNAGEEDEAPADDAGNDDAGEDEYRLPDDAGNDEGGGDEAPADDTAGDDNEESGDDAGGGEDEYRLPDDAGNDDEGGGDEAPADDAGGEEGGDDAGGGEDEYRLPDDAGNDDEGGGDEAPADDTAGDDNEEGGDDAGGEDEYRLPDDAGNDEGGGDEAPADGGGGEETNGDEAPVDDAGGDNEEGGDDESSDEEDDNEYGMDLQADEDELMSKLSDTEKVMQDQELVNNYRNLYSAVDGLIISIEKIPNKNYTQSPLTFIKIQLNDLKKYIYDYLTNVYPTKTWVENNINYQQYLVILANINTMLEQLNTKSADVDK